MGTFFGFDEGETGQMMPTYYQVLTDSDNTTSNVTLIFHSYETVSYGTDNEYQYVNAGKASFLANQS